jgi:hypothetical protein
MSARSRYLKYLTSSQKSQTNTIKMRGHRIVREEHGTVVEKKKIFRQTNLRSSVGYADAKPVKSTSTKLPKNQDMRNQMR